ncbi:MAG TPA: PEP-CTERM sorting domain-containing protein [Gemmatales bacterium]|nr:PEP-CTERM sorting domain-containing protein [Gemmatales bacterium]HMP60196.1 PEP-CTERM sorting domain-containing protein [Gemmatales bacterium]
MRFVLWLAVVASYLVLVPSAHAQSYFGVTIDAQHNIYGAGFGDAPAPSGGGGGLAPPVATIGLTGPLQLTFSSVTGLVTCSVSDPFNGPDGGTGAGGVTNLLSFRDVSGIIHSNRTMFLVGVFRDDSPGAVGGPAPDRLAYSDPENFTSFAPLLNQTFFIGNGRTDSTGTIQQFLVPAGATRLFLGFADGFSFIGLPGAYSDNSGQLVADFAFTPIPEPSVSLLVLGAGIGLVWRRWSSIKSTD